MATAYEDNDLNSAVYAGRDQQAFMPDRYYLERYRRAETAADIESSMSEMRNATGALRTLRVQLQYPRRIELGDSALREITASINRSAILSDALQKQIEARDALDDLGPKIIADVEMVIDQVTLRQYTLGPRGQAMSFWAVVAMCGAALAIVGLGWRISKKLSLRISSDLEEVVSKMSRIGIHPRKDMMARQSAKAERFATSS